MTLERCQKRIYKYKKEKGLNRSDISKEIVCLVEELGELARSYRRHQNDEVVDAIGDLMVYCLGLCEIMNVDAEDLLEKIIENNEDRDYGVNAFLEEGEVIE